MPDFDVSQTKRQEHAGACAGPRARTDWEWFWRIVAGLMLLIIAWAGWVLYQITPTSVVTPLAYATPIRPIGVLPSAGGASAVAPAVPGPPPAPTQADLASTLAQAAARAGAHQAAADVQAAGLGHKEEPAVGLRLATEISAPPVEKQGILKGGEGRDAAAKGRP